MSRSLLIFAFLVTVFFSSCKSSIVDDPSISILYAVTEHSLVTITVINNYNTVIMVPVDREEKLPGAYQVRFDANNLVEGLYYYTLEISGIESNLHTKVTKYLLLVK